MSRFPLALSLALLVASACGEESPTQTPIVAPTVSPVDRATTPATVSVAAPVRTKVIPSPSPLLGEPYARPSRSGGGGGRRMTTQEAEEAAQAIAETEPAGNTPCARAWSVMRDMHRAYRQKTPRARRGGNRARFMQGCRRMPRALQECMNPRHYAENIESCDRLRRTAGRRMRPAPWTRSPEPNGDTTLDSGESDLDLRAGLDDDHSDDPYEADDDEYCCDD